MATRPLGIAILSVLIFILGALLLLGGSIVAVVSGFVAAMSPEMAEEIARAIGQFQGFLFPLV